jgi:hypothetical protein
MRFAAPAVAFEVSHPGAHVVPPPVLLDQLGDAVAALALAFGALHAEHVELPLDVAEGDIGASHAAGQ